MNFLAGSNSEASQHITLKMIMGECLKRHHVRTRFYQNPCGSCSFLFDLWVELQPRSCGSWFVFDLTWNDPHVKWNHYALTSTLLVIAALLCEYQVTASFLFLLISSLLMVIVLETSVILSRFMSWITTKVFLYPPWQPPCAVQHYIHKPTHFLLSNPFC